MTDADDRYPHALGTPIQDSQLGLASRRSRLSSNQQTFGLVVVSDISASVRVDWESNALLLGRLRLLAVIRGEESALITNDVTLTRRFSRHFALGVQL